MIGSFRRQAPGSGQLLRRTCLPAGPDPGQIDLRLDDAELVAICSRALAGRRQRSISFGRCTIARPSAALCGVKHLKACRSAAREELRANLLYRRFTRFYEDPIPDHTVFSRSSLCWEPKGCRLCTPSGHPGQGAWHGQRPLLAHGHDAVRPTSPSQRQFAARRLPASFEPMLKDSRGLLRRRLESSRSCPGDQVSGCWRSHERPTSR